MVLANVFLPTSIKRQCYHNYFTCDTSVVEKPLLDPNCLDNRISNRTLAIALGSCLGMQSSDECPVRNVKNSTQKKKKND